MGEHESVKVGGWVASTNVLYPLAGVLRTWASTTEMGAGAELAFALTTLVQAPRAALFAAPRHDMLQWHSDWHGDADGPECGLGHP